MYLKVLKLQNWQKHKDLTLEFGPKVNVITGATGTGKSCVRRAIAWLFFNLNIKEDDLRTEGEKITIVTGVFDNGIEIERVRAKTINRYILRLPGQEEQVFDSFGKTIPEEITNIIKMCEIEIENESLNLNISEQLSLPFLLDKPASFRAKLFNKLTGNELLDSLFKILNKESLKVSRDLKDTDILCEKQQEDLANYTVAYRECKKKLSIVQEEYEKIKEKEEIYKCLFELSSKLKSNKDADKKVQDRSKEIKLITEKELTKLRDKASLVHQLQELNSELQSLDKNINDLEKVVIKTPVVDFDKLKEKCQCVKSLTEMSNKLSNNDSSIQLSVKTIQELVKNQTILETELKEIWDECPNCPLCGKKKE
jgi:DNA repair exonuclease SbcCD ATPase subunit